MAKRKYKRKIKFIRPRDIMLWGLIIISGLALFYTNTQRVKAGYFTNSTWIFWDAFMYVIFFGLISGYVIAKIISWMTKK